MFDALVEKGFAEKTDEYWMEGNAGVQIYHVYMPVLPEVIKQLRKRLDVEYNRKERVYIVRHNRQLVGCIQ